MFIVDKKIGEKEKNMKVKVQNFKEQENKNEQIRTFIQRKRCHIKFPRTKYELYKSDDFSIYS